MVNVLRLYDASMSESLLLQFLKMVIKDIPEDPSLWTERGDLEMAMQTGMLL